MNIGKIVTVLFIFFLISSGIYLIFINIGLSNTNLSEEAIQDLQNLNVYQENTTNPFGEDVQLNYSLTAYSNTGSFEQSNIESKGALESILDIFGNNKLTAFGAPFLLFNTLSPLPIEAFSWTYTTILSYIAIIVFISFLAAWKGGVFTKT